MITMFDKVHIIKLIKDEGLSIRAVSRKMEKIEKQSQGITMNI